MVPKKIIYYTDLINDDFAFTGISTKKLTSTFKYVHKNFLWRFLSFVLYYLKQNH